MSTYVGQEYITIGLNQVIGQWLNISLWAGKTHPREGAPFPIQCYKQPDSPAEHGLQQSR